MSSEVQIWFNSPPSIDSLAQSLSRFGRLEELRDGSLRLVEGDEDPREGVPFQLEESTQAPQAVLKLSPDVRAFVHASAVLSGSRGFWMGRMAAEIQKQLGGTVYIPSSNQAYSDPHSFEHSWPDDHGGHD